MFIKSGWTTTQSNEAIDVCVTTHRKSDVLARYSLQCVVYVVALL